MSEPELATKAPESDAMEDQPLSPQAQSNGPNTTNIASSTTITQPSEISATDSLAQTGPTMGEHCTTDRPTPLNTATSSGTISPLGGIDTYISKPADYPSTPAKFLLLLTGGTGIHSLNNQLQADRFAAAGYLVIMPDQFANDPAPNSTNRVTSPTLESGDPSSTTSASTPSLLDRIKLGLADTAKSFVIDMWLARQTPEKVLPRLLKALEAARDEYADAIAHGNGIYAVGYCFGARYVLILAGEDPVKHESVVGDGSGIPDITSALPRSLANLNIPGLGSANAAGAAEGDLEAQNTREGGTATTRDEAASPLAAATQPSGPLIKAGAIAHGTQVTRADVRGVCVPLGVIAVQDDPLFPEDVLEVGRKAWAASNVECHVEVFPKGVPHGFAVVGEYEDENIQREQERAWKMMVGWLDSH
jgi:dienelactone hydrolase